jgi:SAM-dependent methyltransferase
MITPPPIDLMYDGPAHDFERNGLEFLGYYKDICGLQPNERMLDVGCGIGRKTIPLTEYLTEGSYEGFDCKEIGIKWCQENITPKYPNFQFQHVNVYAPGYNVEGTILAEGFTFPYPDEEFDFIVLGSVFTHMHHSAVHAYMHEIYRVMKPNGRCFISWFLWGLETQPANFPHRHKYGWCNTHELDFVYETDYVVRLYNHCKMFVSLIEQGTWFGSKGLSYQDLILAEKRV